MSAKKEKAAAMTPADFGKHIETLSKRTKSLFKLEKDLEKANKEGKTSIVAGGEQIDMKKVTGLKKALVKSIKSLTKIYKSGFSRRRGRGGSRSGPNSGFRQPIVMKPELIEFFKRANLGTDLQGRRVQDLLPFLREGEALYGMTPGAILTPLLGFSAKFNILSDVVALSRDIARQQVPEFNIRQLLGADPLMMDVFGNMFRQITAESKLKVQRAGGDDGQPKPQRSGTRQRHYYRDVVKDASGNKVRGTKHPIWNDFYHVFNPHNFAYGNFQSIISHGTYKKMGTPGGLPPTDPRAPLLAKVEDRLAKAYQAAINSGMTYPEAATSAEASVGVAANDQPLLIRVYLDNTKNLLDPILAQYRTAKKSAKK
jgi:hypothetical protein